MKVKDITGILEEFAPLDIQESWDNSGLLIGSPEDEINGVLVGFDCTPELIEEAIQRGCNMVVTHHPLIFRGIKKLNSEDPVGAAVVKAVKAGVAVYACHTTADKVPSGVSGAMAKRLNLQDIDIMEKEADGVGLGCVGYLPKPMTGMEALEYVKEAFGLKIIRHSKPLEQPFNRVAVMGGSGGGDISSAMAAGAQLYITADISYHSFFTPEGFMVMDIGHFESEVDIVDIFLSKIRKNFPNFASYKSAVLDGSNPVRYFGFAGQAGE
jgi:dinuclear metal center YbgI/SA1388 family protein